MANGQNDDSAAAYSICTTGLPASPGAAAEDLGTAQIAEVIAGNSATSVKLASFTPAKEGFDPTNGASFAPGDSGPGFTSAVKGTVRKIPPIQPQYLQFMAAAVVLLTGAFIAFYFAGVKNNTVEFLISTDMEMKKVNWSTRKDIMTSTWVVVGASFLLAGVLFGIDLVFQWLFKLIHVLQ